jgi:hypothetical protein
MLIYSEGLLPHNSLECLESAAPTSEVYISAAIQMIAEYHILWRYAALECHYVPTKNREYQ